MTASKIKQLLDRALLVHRSGGFDEAEVLYREILAMNPGHAQALSMMGMAHMQRGNLEEGIGFLNASLEGNPRQPDVLNNLGLAQQLLGRFDDALKSYDRAIALNSGYAGAYFNRGNLMHDMARYDDARASFEKVLKLQPGHIGALVNLGNSLRELKRHEAALRSYVKAIPLSPPRADIHHNCGLVLLELKRYDEALEHFEQAVRLAPDSADSQCSRACALLELMRHDQALAGFDRAIVLKPDYADAYSGRGLALQQLKRYDEALSSYNRAIQSDPGHVDAYVNRGHFLMEQGQMAEAEQSLREALAVDPENVSAYVLMSQLKKFTAETGEVTGLQALYGRRQELDRDRRIALDFAAGKVWEDLGRYEEAFAAYAEGNHLYHAAHPAAEKAEDELLDWVVSFFTSGLFQQYAEASASLPPVPGDRTPIFIVGMPRSGTTLIEQILASHSNLFGAGELKVIDEIVAEVRRVPHDPSNWKSSLEYFRRMGQEYMDRVWKQAPGAHYITDKMPANYRYLGLIHLMLPHAKIIHAMRDPMDSCFSCYTQNFKEAHDYAYDLETLGRHYLRYMQLMRHWHGVLPPGRILDIRYEDNVADPEREARRLLDYLGLPWDPACLRFYETRRPVSTASVAQVRKPIYSSSVARWKRFEKHLGPLREIVGTQY